MVRVNLLSKTEKKKGVAAPALPRLGTPKAVPLPLLGGVLLLLLVAGAVLLYFNQSRELATLEERLDTAKQDSTRYARAISKLRDIESSQSAIMARIQAIQAVDQGRFRWAHILEELANALPEHTWLTSVVRREDTFAQQAADTAAAQAGEAGEGAAGPPDPVDQIEITGLTFSNLTLTEFMTNLERSPYLEKVSLVGSSRSTVDGVDVTSFALVAAYSQPPSS
jgi:Tfp pilus assembly protein PilN